VRVTESGVDTSACECEREQTASVRTVSVRTGVGTSETGHASACESERRRCERERERMALVRTGASERACELMASGERRRCERERVRVRQRLRQCTREKNARAPSVTRLLSSSQDRRHAASHRDVTSSHTYAPVGRGAGRKTARGSGRKKQLAHWLPPPPPQKPPPPHFPPAPPPPGKTPGP